MNKLHLTDKNFYKKRYNLIRICFFLNKIIHKCLISIGAHSPKVSVLLIL